MEEGRSLTKLTIKYPDGTYYGTIKDGVPDGTGTMTYRSGDKYTGEWLNGTPDGEGTYTLSKKITPSLINGYGLLTAFSKPDAYTGKFKDGRSVDNTTIKYRDGTYIGTIKDGRPDGNGTYTFANGNTYKGQFENGIGHGQGTCTWHDGSSYDGQWNNGKQHGQGTYTWPDGSKYVGEWEAGAKHGLGTMTEKNGDKSTGQWVDGQMHGEFNITHPDEATSTISYRKGKKHGLHFEQRPKCDVHNGITITTPYEDDKQHGEQIKEKTLIDGRRITIKYTYHQGPFMGQAPEPGMMPKVTKQIQL